MARCPVCTCEVVNEERVNAFIPPSSKAAGPGGSISSAAGIYLVGFVCTGCGLRYKFEPPEIATLIVKAVMDS